ncbi:MULTISPECIES: hypothetical protein [unclassified Pseudomonas]|uniref:hypothetical protein n=1 Tax=unclassified Pseudomonas TaxID=196821 RepID=UPI0024494BC1|nr:MULTISPECIES: hypothetical protein [unclassified Pseudomonas]MDH0301942.1 hypothetical protein [Pseudomonas sp. GD04091]MDH1983770.1 hypothetical protein [Pseudomonas sp. GD03689]
MKTIACAAALLAAISATSAFAEGGADRLRERSEQWALQRQQAAEQVAKGEAGTPTTAQQTDSSADQPSS